MAVFKEIKDRCKIAGVTLNKICVAAGVPLSSVHWWNKREPNQITAYRKIDEELKKIEGNERT